MSRKEMRKPGLWDCVLEMPQFQNEQILGEVQQGRHRIKGRALVSAQVEVTAEGGRGVSSFLR